MTRQSSTGAEAEILPRYLFLEPLLAGARVLEIGAVALTGGRGAKLLLDRGAAYVLALDADEQAVDKARANLGLRREGLHFRTGSEKDLPAESFDLVILADGAGLLAETTRLGALKRLLTRDGRLVVSLRDPAGIAFSGPPRERASAAAQAAALLSLLNGAFRTVEAATQTALLAYSVAPEAAAEPETALDESLSDAGTPAFHLFVCGLRPSGLSTTTLAALPSRLLRDLQNRPAKADAERAADLRGLGEELEVELDSQRFADLEERAQSALQTAERAERALADAYAERDELRSRLDASRRDTEAARAEIEQLQSALAQARRDVMATERERAELWAELKYFDEALTAE
ncbi:MAG: methyltransferase domain-containing protein, partial [Myxococcales bacterium]